MATTGIAHGRKLHVPGNVQVIGGDAFELIRNRSGLRFRSNPAHYCPDNVTDFALSGCEDGVAGDIDCPTISPSVISTAVLRTLEFAFSFAIKAACTCNTVAISLCILLSRLSIVSIRFQVRTLLLIRTATTTRAQIANAMYSAVIKRESARSTISRNLSYSTTREKDSQQVSRRSVFTQPGPKAAVTGIRPRRQLSEDELPSAPMWRHG